MAQAQCIFCITGSNLSHDPYLMREAQKQVSFFLLSFSIADCEENKENLLNQIILLKAH